jgi:hypothetical protein
MGLEEFIPQESSEQWSAWAEIAEKIREGIKKWTAGSKRVRKDEKKAKQYDMSLANFLVKILLEKKYDTLFDSMFGSIHAGIPSNLVMWILSLIYFDISNYIREFSKKEPLDFHFSSTETINFSDSDLPESVKQRINDWIEDIIDILRHDPSTVLVDKTIDAIKNSEEIYVFWTKVFIYFMNESNIYVRESKARDYIDFIYKQVILKKIEGKAFQDGLDTL